MVERRSETSRNVSAQLRWVLVRSAQQRRRIVDCGYAKVMPDSVVQREGSAKSRTAAVLYRDATIVKVLRVSV